MAYYISSGITSDGIILTNDAMYVSNGGMANETTVNISGSMFVYVGGEAKDTIVNSGGLVFVDSGSATGVTVHSGGSLFVYFHSGFASNASLDVGAVVSTYYGGFFNLVSADSAITFDRIDNQGAYANNGQSDFAFAGNLTIESGGSASAVSIQKGGSLYISSGGTADGVIVNSGATLSPNTIGADVKNVKVSSGGLLNIDNGSATGIEVHSGGSLFVYFHSGFASNASLDVGAVVSTYYGGFFNLVSADSAITFDRIDNQGAYANNGQSDFSYSGKLFIEAGGSASSFTIQDGTLLVYGSAGNITLDGGHVSTFETTQLNGATVNEGATFNLTHAGADAKNVEVNAGGLVYVENGSATGVAVHSGGSMRITHQNGFISNASLDVGAVVSVYHGGFFNLVSASSAITFDRINNQGIYANNGQSDFTFTGNLFIEAGGSASSLTIQSGGSLYVSSGGTANGVSVNEGATFNLPNAGADVQNVEVNSGGSVFVENGSAMGVAVHSGGSMRINHQNGFVSNASLDVGTVVSTYYGGFFSLFSASSAITFDRINNQGIYANNGQSDFSYSGKLFIEAGGSASSFTMENGGLLVYGCAKDITINGGYVSTYSTTQLNGATVNEGATFNLTSAGADVQDVEVNAGGLVYVENGSATGVAIRSGGSMRINYQNGFVSNASLDAGAVVSTYFGGFFNLVSASSAITFDRIDNTRAFANGGQSDFAFGGRLCIEAGGSASSFAMESGELLVYGSVENITLNGGRASGYSTARLNDVTINEGATLFLYQSGADVRNVEINAGGQISVDSNTVTDITVHSGGSIQVYNNGVASNVIVEAGTIIHHVNHGRYFNLVSMASSAIAFDRINGERVYANNGQSDFSFAGKLNIESGGSASSFTMESGELLVYGSAQDITLNGGKTSAFNTAKLDGVTINEGAALFLYQSGADVRNVEINAGGQMSIDSNTVTDVTVHSGGSIQVYNNGVASNVIVEAGTIIHHVNHGRYFNLISMASSAIEMYRIDGQKAYVSGDLNDITYSGYLYLSSGSYSNISAYQMLEVASGATATNIEFFEGEMRLSGSAENITLNGGRASGYSTARLNDVTINEGATLFLYQSGADVRNVEINAGGQISVDSNTVTDITVHSGGSIQVYNNGVASNVIVEAGTIIHHVNHGRYFNLVSMASSAIAFDRINGERVYANNGQSGFSFSGNLSVESGGSASSFTMQDGELFLYGSAENITLNGGRTSAFSTAQLDGAIVNENASLFLYNSGADVKNIEVNTGGLVAIASASATDMTVHSGGSIQLHHGGIASNVSIETGAVIHHINYGRYFNLISAASAITLYSIDGTEIKASGALSDITYSGQLKLLSGSYSNISAYQSLQVASGATADNIEIIGGRFIVDSGAEISNITLTSSYIEGAIPSIIDKLTLNSASYIISSGRTVSNGTVNRGGLMTVSSSGVLDHASVTDGGTVAIGHNGSVSSITASSGGVILLNNSRAHIADGQILSGGSLVFSNGSANGIVQADGGILQVFLKNNNDTAITGVNQSGDFSVSGGTASSLVIHSAGLLSLESGCSAVNTVMEDGGRIQITLRSADDTTMISGRNENGDFSVTNGVATNVILHSGAFLGISSDAYAVNTEVHSGANVNGFLFQNDSTFIEELRDGELDVSNVIIREQTFIGSGHNISEAVIETGGLNLYGRGENVVLSGSGNISIGDGGVLSNVSLQGANNGRGNLDINNGAKADGVIVNSNGQVNVFSGGTASGIELADEGYLNVAVAPGTYVQGTRNESEFEMIDGHFPDYAFSRGTVAISSGGVADNMMVEYEGRIYVSSGGIANGGHVNSGGNVYASNGGTMNGVTANNQGSMFISSGAAATGIVENGGYVWYANEEDVSFASNTISGQVLFGGITLHSKTTAIANTINGSLFVYSGGFADSSIVNSYGKLHVSNGGVANGTIINTRGSMYVSNGGRVDSSVVGGYYAFLLVSSGAIADNTVIKYDGRLDVSSGGQVNNTTANHWFFIFNGGTANITTVNSGGIVWASNGGIMNNATVNNCGSLYIVSGATATEIQENGGYVWYENEENVRFASNSFSGLVLTGSVTIHSNTQAIDNTVDSYCGTTVFSGGVAEGTTINRNGWLFISSGGFAVGTVVQSGGDLQVWESGIVSETVISMGTVNVAGGTAHVASMNGGKLNISSGSIVVLNKTVFENNASVTVVSGTDLDMTMVSGSATLALELGANLSIKGNDLSQMKFNFTGAGTVDLSGNYWGTTDIDAIYAKLGVDYSKVMIDDVLLTDPTTVFSIVSNTLNHNYIGKGTDSITFTLAHDIDTGTVSPEKISMTSTQGDAVAITEISVDGKQLTVKFDPVQNEGNYRITFADTIADIAGEKLVSLRETGLADGVGEQLNLRADFTSPYVVKVSPDGDFAGTLNLFTVYFSGAVDPITVMGNVQLIAPNGRIIAPTASRAITNSIFEFSIPEQTAYGSYQIRVLNNVADYAGNKLDQNQNGIGGEADDAFVSGFVIADVDLKIQNLELSKTTLSLGESVTLNWEVINSSGYALFGSWTDGVYLSKDARWDVNDILLGSVTHPDGLGENQTIDSSLTVNFSGVKEGDYYLLVRSDIYMQEQTNRETAEAAQNLEAAAITVAIPQLTLDTAMNGTVQTAGDYAYYTVHQDANQSLKLVLDSLVGSADMELYLGFDSAPTTEIYDKKVTGIVNGAVFLDAQLSERDVYIMARAKKTASEFDYTLTAQSVPMSITKVTGTEQGNRTTTYLDVSGVDFSADSIVSLRDAEGNTVAPSVLHFIDSTRLKLEFEAGTLAPGDYALTVVSGNEMATADETITIVDESGAFLDVSLNLPARVGYHLLATISVDYANTGYDAADAILIMVSPSQNNADGITRNGAIMTLNQSLVNDGFWVKTLPEGFSTSVSFLASGESAGLIMPGENLSVDIYYTGWLQNYNGSWDFSYPAIDWNAKYITSDNEEEIDWNSFLDPNEYSAEYRAFLTEAFQNSIGTTWGDYVRMLSKNLQYLDNLGFSPAASGNTHAVDTNALYTFELKQADGALSPYQKLESVSDLSSGLIQFSREYHSNVSSRYRKSSFGYGWSCNWDISLSFDETGDIIMRNGETVTTFQPTFYDTYTALGTGLLVKTSTGYSVATADGATYKFDKNGLLQSVTDKNNNTITTVYSDGKLIGLTGSDGSSVSLTWNEAGLIESISDSSGTTLNYGYDANGNLVSAGDEIYTYSNTLDHALTSAGTERKYGYNENGLLADIINGTDEIDLQYGENGEVHETSNTGTDIVYYYGSNNKVLKEVNNATGVTTKYQYDGATLLSITDSDGNTKVYNYDSNGKLLSYAVNGNVVGYTYDAAGNIASYTDENGVKTEYDYDRNKNITAAYYADGTAEYWDYNANGLLTGYTDINGLSLQYSYNAQGECISVTLDDSAVTASGLVYGTFTVDGAIEKDSWLIVTNKETEEYQLFQGDNCFFVGNGLEAGEYTLELQSGDSSSYFAAISIEEDSSLDLGNIALMTGGDLTFSLDINYTATNDIIVAGLYKDDIAVASTYLDESGEYSFANIAPGDYILKLESTLYPQFDLEQTISIQSAETTEISLSTDSGVTLSGTIVDANGNALAGVLLRLDPFDESEEENEAEGEPEGEDEEDENFILPIYTDSSGNYSFENLKSGKYTISLVESEEILGEIDIESNHTGTIERVLQTDYSATLSGWLKDEDGNNQNGIVYLCRDNVLLASYSSQDGYYCFAVKDAGDYTVLVENQDGLSFTDSYNVKTGDHLIVDPVLTTGDLQKSFVLDFDLPVNAVTCINVSDIIQTDSYRELSKADRFAYLFNWGNAGRLNDLIKKYNSIISQGDSLLGIIPKQIDSEHLMLWNLFSSLAKDYKARKSQIEKRFQDIELWISKSAVSRWKKANELISKVRNVLAKKYGNTWLGKAINVIDKYSNQYIEELEKENNPEEEQESFSVVNTGVAILQSYLNKTDRLAALAFKYGVKVVKSKEFTIKDFYEIGAEIKKIYEEARPIYRYLSFQDKQYYSNVKGLKEFFDWFTLDALKGKIPGNTGKFLNGVINGANLIMKNAEKIVFYYDQLVISTQISFALDESQRLIEGMDEHIITSMKELLPLPACPCDVCPHCNSVLCDGEVLLAYEDHWEHKNIDTGETICSGTYDPNDILGPEGHGEEGYIAKQTMDYTIQFENDPEWANSPVKWVRVYNTLDNGLNPETVQFREVCLAGNLIKLDGQSSYNQRTTITVEGKEITVDVKLNVVWNDETESWQMVAEVMAIDPETGFMLQDVDLGFLYPNDESGRGDGHIRYTVELADDVTTGTVISNSAQIFFDFNEPIDTPVWTNTIDADAPSAATFTASASTETTEITLTLSANDACSGIAGFNVRYSTDGITFMDYGLVSGTELIFTGDSAATYFFVAQAVDNAGNKSAWSESVSVRTIDLGYPVLPDDLTVSVDGYSAAFTWSGTDDVNVAGYKLIVDGTEYAAEATALSVDGLAIGRHTYRLCAYNAAGLETWTDTRNFSVSDVTAPVLGGTPAASVSGSAVTFSWTEATDNVRVTGYKLAVGDAVYTTKNTSYSLDDVYFGDYFYRICAVDAAGNEAWSDDLSFSVERAVLSNDVLLPNVVPHVDYAAGCVPTAVGMLLGYYDRHGYDGYSVARLVKGTIGMTDGVADETLVNFIASEGHSERFFDKTAEEELQYTVDLSTKQLLTASWDCLADWLGTSQYWRGNSDYATSFYSQPLSWLLSTPQTYSVDNYSLSAKNADFKYGLALYLNAVGYSLNADATQSVSVSDYSFDEFKSEIDAGHVVLVSLSSPFGGHMVTAYGYNMETKEIIFDDAYSRDCRMAWGGTYTLNGSSYSISAITLIAFDTTGLSTDFEAPILSDSLSATIKGDKIIITWNDAADSSDVFYSLNVNGVVFEGITGNSFVVSDIKLGDYTYSLCAYDAAGNYSAWSKPETVTVSVIDTVPPEKPQASADVETETNRVVIVSAMFSDDSVVREYSLDDGESWLEYTEGIQFTKNGTVLFRGKDEAGNISETIAYEVTNIDNVAPVITLDGDNQTPLKSTTLTATVDDGSPVYYRIGDSGEWTEYKEPITVTDNATYNFLSKDAAGNEGTNFLTFDNIDNVAPVITLDGDNQTPLKSTTLTATVDDGSPVYYRIGDSGEWTEYKEPITVTDNATYNFLSKDAAGNEGTNFLTFDNIDNVAPVITLDGDNQTPLKSTTLTATVDDGSPVYYRIGDSGEWTEYKEPITVTDNATYNFLSKDAAGNEGTNFLMFDNIDNVAPVITLDGDNQTPLKSTTLTATVDDGSPVYYRIGDSGEWTEYKEPITVTDNATYNFLSKDAAGNEGTNFLMFDNIDNVVPVITLDGDNQTPLQKATLTAAVDDGSTIYYRIGDTGDWMEYKEPITVTDNVTYNFKATDAAGNVGTSFFTFENIIQAPISDVVPQTQTWEKVEEATQYIVEYSTDNFEHVIQLVVDSNSLDSFQMPAGNYQMRVKADGIDEWTVAKPVVAEEANNAPKHIKSNADGNADVFFVNTVGTWESGYVAQHVSSTDDETWDGTSEFVSVFGKNKLTDIIEGSTDANVLLMTDDANGDAMFVDDIYSASPDELGLSQSRIAQIDEIRAGAGNDIVDMTSDKFEYTGDGLTIRGGNGNDTIWANKGDNFLFGDAGNDRIVGASGNDVIAGGIGNDRLHGGGGEDVFTFCDNWGVDEVEQLVGGSVTLWFTSEKEGKVAWDDVSKSYTDGVNQVSVKGVTSVELKFGDDGSSQYASLVSAGAFAEFTSQKIFEESNGLLAGQ